MQQLLSIILLLILKLIQLRVDRFNLRRIILNAFSQPFLLSNDALELVQHVLDIAQLEGHLQVVKQAHIVVQFALPNVHSSRAPRNFPAGKRNLLLYYFHFLTLFIPDIHGSDLFDAKLKSPQIAAQLLFVVITNHSCLHFHQIDLSLRLKNGRLQARNPLLLFFVRVFALPIHLGLQHQHLVCLLLLGSECLVPLAERLQIDVLVVDHAQ